MLRSLRLTLQRFFSSGHLRCHLFLLNREHFLEQVFQSLGATPRAGIVGISRLRDLCNLYERQFYKQTFVGTCAIVDVALVHDFQRLIEELRSALLGLCLETLPLRLADFKKGNGLRVTSHHHIAHVRSKAIDKMTTIKTVGQDLVEQKHDVGSLVFKGEVDDSEIVFGIEHIEVFYDLLIGDVSLAEGSHLVKNGQCIAHTSVGLFGNHSQSLFLIGVALFLGNHLQVVDSALNRHTLEIINLTARDNGRQNLVLLCGCQYEDDMRGRFLQSLQESIESLC